MKAFALASLLLLALASLPATAHAQQQGAITVQLQAPAERLSEGAPSVSFAGIVTFTTDLTVMTGLMGIPVTYTVTKQPSWATVIVSPASDIFPAPSIPTGISYTAQRPITVTVSLNSTPTADVSDVVEITATTGAASLGKSFTGRGSTLVGFDAPEEPCLQHTGMTAAQMESLAIQAAQAYDEYQAANAQQQPDEVTTQSTATTPVTSAGLAVAGCVLAGAGIGLVLRRRIVP